MFDPLCYLRSKIETHLLHPDFYLKDDLPINVDPLVWRFDGASHEECFAEAFGDVSLAPAPFRPLADLFIEIYTYVKDINAALAIRSALENRPFISPIPEFFPFDNVVKWDVCLYTPLASSDTSGLPPCPDYTVRFRRGDSGIVVVGLSYFLQHEYGTVGSILALPDSKLDDKIFDHCSESEERIIQSVVKGVSHEHAMPLLLEYFEAWRERLGECEFDREWPVSEGVQKLVSDEILRQTLPHEKN